MTGPRLARRSVWLILVLCLAGLSGCKPFDHYDTSLYGPSPQGCDPPRELAKVSMPPYRVEPPDVLQLEVLKLIPLPPYRLEPADVLQIVVLGTNPELPAIQGLYPIDEGGHVNLGPGYEKPGYPRIRVAGLTVQEAQQAIDRYLDQFIRTRRDVNVQIARVWGIQQTSGTYLVAQDGTINLRRYGLVPVARKTLPEIRAAIEAQLSQYFEAPQVSVDVIAYNSKVYYIVTSGAGLGDNLVKVPITGNETVLDAVAQVQGLSQVSSKKVWIARPAPHGFPYEQVLPVDYQAVVRGGSTSTNYQLFPGDRVYIESDHAIAFNNWLNKILSPLDRVTGTAALTGSTISTYQNLGRGHTATFTTTVP